MRTGIGEFCFGFIMCYMGPCGLHTHGPDFFSPTSSGFRYAFHIATRRHVCVNNEYARFSVGF